jgi:hypothetical protein
MTPEISSAMAKRIEYGGNSDRYSDREDHQLDIVKTCRTVKG